MIALAKFHLTIGTWHKSSNVHSWVIYCRYAFMSNVFSRTCRYLDACLWYCVWYGFILASPNLFCCNILSHSRNISIVYQKTSPAIQEQLYNLGGRNLDNKWTVPGFQWHTSGQIIHRVINLAIRKSVIKYSSTFHCTISTHHNN